MIHAVQEMFLPTPNPMLVDAPAVASDPKISTTQRRKDARSNIIFFFAVIILLFVAFKLAKELEILYVSALFAVVLMPLVNRITSMSIRGYRPGRAVAIVLLLFVTILLLVVFFLIGLPPVMNDLRNFMTDLPGRIPGIVDKLKHVPMADKLGVDTIAARAESTAAALGSYVFTSLPNWLSHIFDILTAIFLCIYFMLEGEHAYEFFLSLFRSDARGRLDATLRTAEVKMSKWLLGQGLLMLALGVASLIVFGILHVRYFILLGVLMGLLNIIPIAGGVVTVAIAAGVAAIDSWQKMFGVLIFYLIYVNLENAVLTPRIMRSSVNLMGLTVLVALLLGTALAGVVGALVAVPTAALISVLLDEYLVHHDAKT